MEEPQVKLSPKVDNSTSPFKPSLRNKPNAIKPLNIFEKTDKDGTISFSHPYLHELIAFKVPSRQLESSAPIPPSDIDSSPDAIFVDDDESLALMTADLEKVNEIAIDTEFYDYRSFYGVLCVLQVSTRTRDYVIDAIKLKNELEVLNKFFTDPKVLKVMHAGENDLPWLQKDLNLYVVNMFDTRVAATKLGAEKLGLAALLKEYCDVFIEKDKRFQKLFDWRERPLPSEAITYARGDTHYLLYLHDILRNELIEKSKTADLLRRVYNKSTEFCKKMYRKPPSGLPALLRKYPNDYRKRYALRLLYEWRDNICRKEDESTGYVLPKWALLLLVDRLPGTENEIRKVLERHVAPITLKCVGQLTELIAEARKLPRIGAEPSSSDGKKRNKGRTHPLATQVDENGKARKKPEINTENLSQSVNKRRWRRHPRKTQNDDSRNVCSQSAPIERIRVPGHTSCSNKKN